MCREQFKALCSCLVLPFGSYFIHVHGHFIQSCICTRTRSLPYFHTCVILSTVSVVSPILIYLNRHNLRLCYNRRDVAAFSRDTWFDVFYYLQVATAFWCCSSTACWRSAPTSASTCLVCCRKCSRYDTHLCSLFDTFPGTKHICLPFFMYEAYSVLTV